jgi:hypothetical protein
MSARAAWRLEALGFQKVYRYQPRRIVLGKLRPRDLDAQPDALAAEIMIEGPRTIRGTRAAAEMARWLDERGVPGVLVTTADGELIGYVRRDEL